MACEYTYAIALPHELSDEAAAQLLEWLYELTAQFEDLYGAQLQRYYQCTDPRQQPLWREDEPPF